MKLLFFTSFICILTISCTQQQEPEPPIFGMAIGSDIDLSIQNPQGVDLISPATEEYFPVEDMQLYYLVDGKKVKVQDFDPQIGGHNGLKLLTGISTHKLRCFLYNYNEKEEEIGEDGVKKGTSMYYLQLNQNITDTIKTEWEALDGRYYAIRKVWYNGELSEEEPFDLTIVKGQE